MIGQLISLYRARKDPALAKHIASEMLVEGVIERASWPIVVAKIWLALFAIVSMILICVFLALTATAHWSFAIFTVPFGGVVYSVIKLWRGVNTGIEHVSDLAKAEIHKRTTRVQNSDPV